MPEYARIDTTLEVVGTIAFAISGALLAIRKNMDLMGVAVLGLTTAVGGGILRDVVLGVNPPSTFVDARYIYCSIISALIVFAICYANKNIISSQTMQNFENINAIFDAIGLGAFTVTGINAAVSAGYYDKITLIIFCGMITAVGGGAMRDIFANATPFIFKEEIYASASLAGAVFYVAAVKSINQNYVMIFSALIVCVIRLFALKKNLGLPKIK